MGNFSTRFHGNQLNDGKSNVNNCIYSDEACFFVFSDLSLSVLNFG